MVENVFILFYPIVCYTRSGLGLEYVRLGFAHCTLGILCVAVHNRPEGV